LAEKRPYESRREVMRDVYSMALARRSVVRELEDGVQED
jgi:hypothetical protein